MFIIELKFLNDKVIKKVLSYENQDIRNYVARIIAHTTNIPYECLKDNLVPVHPEFGSNANIINSVGDLPFFDGNIYFGIEVNYSRSSISKTKSITYGYQLTLRQLINSENYKNLKPITIININARDNVYGLGEFVYETTLMETKHHTEYTNLIKIYDINLSYFKKVDYNKINEGLLKDLALFVVEDETILSKIYKGDKEVHMVKKNLENFLRQFDEAFYCSEEELQRQIDEEMKEEGFKEGFDSGFNEGLNKGLNEGRDEGSKQEKIKLIKAMLKMDGITKEQISKLTGFTIEEIENL